jgi:ATP-binding cassette subfamily C protein
VIGRGDDCAVVLKDHRVSRRHARVELVPEGVRLVDAGSANGVFLGEKQVTEAWLSHGARFRVGDTVFEFLAPSAPAPASAAPSPPPEEDMGRTLVTTRLEFLVRVVASKSGTPVGKEFKVAGSATLGRGEECDIVLADTSSSRRHARIEVAGPSQFRLVDTNSSNGVWMEDRRVADEQIGAGQRFRIGDTFLECHMPSAERKGTGATQVMGDLGELLAKVAAHRLENAGEVVTIGGSKAVLLNDPQYAYYVVTGKVEVFTVTVKEGRPLGARNHFLTLGPGDALFGVDLRYTGDSGFLAAGKTGTEVRRIAMTQLRAMAEEPNVAAQVARLVDTWVTGLAGRLTRDIFPRPETDVKLTAGQSASLARGQKAKAADGVVWIAAGSGSLLYIGMSTVVPEHEQALFPLTPQTWAEPASESVTEIALAPRPTLQLLADPSLWAGLDLFHQVLSECEFINKRLAVVDEFQRLDSKARQADAAREEAYDAIGAVLAGRHQEPIEAPGAGKVEPVVLASRLVGQALGVKIKTPAESRVQRTFEDHLAAIAAASRFRTRRVALRGEWWTRDQGPFLARGEQSGAPLAMIPKGKAAYQCVDPVAKTRQRMTPEIAANLAPFAYTFYRPFPAGELSVLDLLRFGGQGLKGDFWTIIAMGVITGVLGAASPYLTGQMIDSAIPQGDRGLLIQLGLGMLVAALASAAFKITQAVAVVRVETRMDYVLQAALWDRLMDLPSGFFRKYGAGDLAERASGINAIRGLISRAGVGGILGSLSSLAYVAMMLTYNVKLSAVAMLITLVLVSFTTVGNYAQLKNQREETKLRGSISSLVLQLIVGVAKVRVSAAENHAFRVWAQRFSLQKRIGFAIGQVQNVVATFSSAFQVLSSLGIFGALFYLQSTAGPNEPPPFTTGTFIAFNSAFAAFVGAMQALADASLSLLRAVPIYERVKPILNTIPETDESKAHPGKLRGELSVSHLNFRYHDDGPWIIKDVTFTLKPGEFVAFVGGSGCGKSTMMRLLLGFEKPALGAIYYDGQDLSTLDVKAVRQQLGVVLQESRVLPTDIYRNIVGTSSHTMDEAWEAAEMAGLAEDVRQMPMGMRTVVSEGGGTFSGGQRQRLLIARALVNKPRVIFFDEATSALDNRTQAVVTQSMDRLDATRIVIAHRLSTVVNASRIFYYEGGQIREEGTYEELMAKNGLFAELAKRQIV